MVVWQFEAPPERPRREVRRALLQRVLTYHGKSGELRRACDHCGARDHGRPRLAPHDDTPACFDFNLSATDGAVVIACSGGLGIGIDVESLRRSVPEGMGDHLGAGPRTDPHTQLDIWVAKEAVLKCVGVGLAEPISTVALEAPPARGRFTRARLRTELVATVTLIDVG
ncbi:MAG: hypothetical protein R3320_08620, partial [Nitriliruptorales bacterium]|nr:hypothetical protein [Nitriliruptorales bacterium]